MNRLAVNLARRLYAATPSPAVRRLYLKTFLSLVRGRTVVTSVDGLTFDLNLGETIDVGLYLGRYEPDVVAVMESVCRDGWRALDVGANVGAHTIRLARLVGEQGHVHAFEPMEWAYRKLIRNVALNPFRNITAFRLALAERSVRDQVVGFRVSWRTDGRRVDSQSVADLERLDDWCARQGVRDVDLLKLDVDGDEYSVLAGGSRCVERSRPIIIFECADYHFREIASNPVAWLRERGYEILNARSRRLYENLGSIRQECEGVDSINLVALPDLGSAGDLLA